MTTTWKLSKELTSLLDQARSMLDDELSEMRAAWDEKSESWQEGEKGTEVSAWFDGLDLVAEALEEVEAKP